MTRNRNRFIANRSNGGGRGAAKEPIPDKEKNTKRRKKDTSVARAALQKISNLRKIEELFIKNKNITIALPEEIIASILKYIGIIHSNDGYNVLKLGYNEIEPSMAERRKRVIIYRLMTCSSEKYIKCMKYLYDNKHIFTNVSNDYDLNIHFNLKYFLKHIEDQIDRKTGGDQSWWIDWEVKWSRRQYYSFSRKKYANSLMSCIRLEPAEIFTEEILKNI
jgi:hypothetical protein